MIPPSATEATHAAAPSLLGYLYQVRVALVELLQRSRSDPSVALTIEQLDDIAFEAHGTPTELLQTKHHIRHQGALTDSSPDLWRTIRVWSDAVHRGDIDVSTTTLTLLTTGTAPVGSIAEKLRPEPRDPSSALAALERIARTSTAAAQAASYASFLKLAEPDRKALVEAIVVLDRGLVAADLQGPLAVELGRAAERRLVLALAERLTGWWDNRVLHHLTATTPNPIYGEEVEQKISDLRDEFASENLPIDDIGEEELASLSVDDRIFVRQLQLIAANDQLIELAIRDYKRAYQQKARWVRDGLVVGDELARYERRLEDEWLARQAFIQQRLADSAAESDRERAGMDLYEDMHGTQLWIRPRVQWPFVVRGSLHKLADELRVGWHPDFVDRLRHLLKETA